MKLLLYCNLQKKWFGSAWGWKQRIYSKKAEKQSLQHNILDKILFPKVLEAPKSWWYYEKLSKREGILKFQLKSSQKSSEIWIPCKHLLVQSQQ